MRARVFTLAVACVFLRFRMLCEESELFCVAVGLPKDVIITILKSDTDWAFILKVDALMESAAKHTLRHGLCVKLAKKVLQNETLEEFVDALPMNGRTSLHKLLEAAGLPSEELGFIETTRLVRNAFAHNIEYADLRLIDIIMLRQDKSRLIRYLSAIAKYDEAKLIADYEKDPSFLRLCIIDSTMRCSFMPTILPFSSCLFASGYEFIDPGCNQRTLHNHSTPALAIHNRDLQHAHLSLRYKRASRVPKDWRVTAFDCIRN